MFKFFRKRDDEAHKRIDDIHKGVGYSFTKIKDDISNLAEWVNHFDEHKKIHSSKVNDIENRLKILEDMLLEIKDNDEAVQTKRVSKQLSKQTQTAVRPNRLSEGVQTEIHKLLISLTPMERAVVWALLNTDIKLSYSDMSNLLGKDESTVRGQVTNIKRKIPELILEQSESNGKKRYYISEGLKVKVIAQYAQKRRKKKGK